MHPPAPHGGGKRPRRAGGLRNRVPSRSGLHRGPRHALLISGSFAAMGPCQGLVPTPKRELLTGAASALPGPEAWGLPRVPDSPKRAVRFPQDAGPERLGQPCPGWQWSAPGKGQRTGVFLHSHVLALGEGSTPGAPSQAGGSLLISPVSSRVPSLPVTAHPEGTAGLLVQLGCQSPCEP